MTRQGTLPGLEGLPDAVAPGRAGSRTASEKPSLDDDFTPDYGLVRQIRALGQKPRPKGHSRQNCDTPYEKDPNQLRWVLPYELYGPARTNKRVSITAQLAPLVKEGFLECRKISGKTAYRAFPSGFDEEA